MLLGRMTFVLSVGSKDSVLLSIFCGRVYRHNIFFNGTEKAIFFSKLNQRKCLKESFKTSKFVWSLQQIDKGILVRQGEL